jgi:pseudouridine-5'-phosphate glycosidase
MLAAYCCCCCCCKPALLCRAARLIRASHDLQLDTGMLLAVPIPAAAAAEGASIQQAIQDSLREADARGIAGAEVRGGLAVAL